MANSNALDPTYPYIDIKISAVITTHTETIAKNAYEEPLPLDPTKTDKHPENLRRGWNAIAKVLENTVNKTNTHYEKLTLDHPVVPIVISAGGTLHKTAHKFLKHLGTGQAICTEKPQLTFRWRSHGDVLSSASDAKPRGLAM